jgi:hypothetical protein
MTTLDQRNYLPYTIGMDTKSRFWSKVNKQTASGCWEWMGSITKAGYGQFAWKGPKYAHRVSAEWSGLCVADKIVCHRCDNPKCVNPDHLFAGDTVDNIKDMVSKGRHLQGRVTAAKKNQKPIMTPVGRFESLKDAKKALHINPRTLRDKLMKSNSGYYYLDKI